MDKFLSCDWGTTSFRLRLINKADCKVIVEEKNDQGIAKTYELWKQSKREEVERLPFYREIIHKGLESVEQRLNTSLQGAPIIISGMASSTIGMINLPYKTLPTLMDGSELEVKIIEAESKFNHKLIIVSGLRTADDVIRGEETKLLGCELNFSEDTLFDAITVFDIDYSKFHLGSITIMKLIEWCIENEIKILDFSKGYFEYKRRWCTKIYDFETLRV